MVNIIHHGENIEKMTEITEAAQKRFGMYGMDKTSMKEIAADLGMSKGSLYYYFPDKEQLYIHVIEKEQEVFIEKINEAFSMSEDPVNMLKEYVRIRLLYLRKLLNLSRFRLEDYMGIKPIFTELRKSFQAKQAEIIESILIKGIKKNIFYIEDPKDTAELFLDVLIGLANTVLKHKDIFYLEDEEYNMVMLKSNKFTEMFIKAVSIGY